VIATLLAVQYLSAIREGSRPTDLERLHEKPYRVDLNSAPLAELEQLPNVGPQRAKQIDAYRHLHGGFRSIEELRKVPGIGVITFEGLRDLVTVSAADHDEGPAPRLPPPPTASKKHSGPGKKELALQGIVIDVNRASRDELQRLPGIGPKMSQRILDERARGRFKTVDELRRVSGIGAKTLERLRPYVRVGGPPQVAAAEED
jgi:competence protein ComEA